MIVVLRVWIPDRPGALGQVASRIGAVRGDVLAIEILERGAGRAIDELVVELPSDDLLDLLTREVHAIDGVSVEECRVADENRADPSRAALAAAVAVAESEPTHRLEQLAAAVFELLDATWTMVLDGERAVHILGEAPDVDWLSAFIAGSSHLSLASGDMPADVVWSSLDSVGVSVLAGRSGRPVHARERERISLLARLVDATSSALPTP